MDQENQNKLLNIKFRELDEIVAYDEYEAGSPSNLKDESLDPGKSLIKSDQDLSGLAGSRDESSLSNE